MHILMSKGSASDDVERLRRALAKALGEDAKLFPSLQASGTPIDEDFDGAIRRWQAGVGLIGDGVVGPRCQLLLDLIAIDAGKFELTLNVGNVSRLFPATKPANIARYLPYIEAALGVAELTDRPMILGALGTIRAETEGFVPIAEVPSQVQHPAGRRALQPVRHARRARQQPGRRRRALPRPRLRAADRQGQLHPLRPAHRRAARGRAGPGQRAGSRGGAAGALSSPTRRRKFRQAIHGGDFAQARKLVNGGVARPRSLQGRVRARRRACGRAARVGAGGAPARCRCRREPPPRQAPAQPLHRLAHAQGRGRPARPRRSSRARSACPTNSRRRRRCASTCRPTPGAGLILDQGREGACTGFGLTCVVNYLRWVKAGLPPKMESVSPRMLYTLARRHDEYDGENYEGSSCRGALKGWFNHGVCLEPDWPYLPEKSNPATLRLRRAARRRTRWACTTASTPVDHRPAGGHRAAPRGLRLGLHARRLGRACRSTPAPKRHADLPVIAFDGRRSETGGHAFALVGFNAQGFILQNSWGNELGRRRLRGAGLPRLAGQCDGRLGGLAGRARRDRRPAGRGRQRRRRPGRRGPQQVVGHRPGLPAQRGAGQRRPREPLPHRGRAAAQAAAAGLRAAGPLVPQAGGARASAWCSTCTAASTARRRRSSAPAPWAATSSATAAIRCSWCGRPGLLESIGEPHRGRLRAAQPARAGVGEWLSEKTDLLVEKSVGRPVGAAAVERDEGERRAGLRRSGAAATCCWTRCRRSAATGATQFELHLVGHSAGAIASATC